MIQPGNFCIADVLLIDWYGYRVVGICFPGDNAIASQVLLRKTVFVGKCQMIGRIKPASAVQRVGIRYNNCSAALPHVVAQHTNPQWLDIAGIPLFTEMEFDNCMCGVLTIAEKWTVLQ